MLLALIDEAFEKRAWHGPNLRGILRGVTAAEAAWRPAPGRHNIWELTVHAAYWKYTVRRRITGEKRGSFTLHGSNWFTRPDADSSEKAWKRDVALLVAEHKQMRTVIDNYLRNTRKPTDKMLFQIRGIAMHDLYHAGQIQILKRLHSAQKSQR